MEIKTKGMGIVKIESEQIITLDEGFYGFEEFHKFAVLDSQQPPFIWIQSLEDENLAFIAIDPFIFRPDYELDIDNESLEVIGLTSPKDALVFSLVTIPKDGSPITANLQGPLIINKQNKKGIQAAVNNPKWKTKHDIIAELNAAGRK